MKFFVRLRSLAARFFRQSAVAEDMEEELATHIALRADDLVHSGLLRPEAERRARIEFGARERYKEESFATLGGSLLDAFFRDIRLALRVLRKSPGFTVAAIVTLAMAIGANAVVFGILDALVLRPLNVPSPQNLYGTEYGDNSGFQSYPNYLDLRDRNHSFDSLAAFNFVFAGLDTGNNPSLANGFATSGNYFDVLRIQPLLGRFFHPADERGPGSAPYIVLGYDYWHTHFQDNPAVIGRTVLLNKHPFTVIGVAPPAFRGTLMFIGIDFFMPIVNQDQVGGTDDLHARGNNGTVFEVFGHLKPGVTLAQAESDVNSIGAALQQQYPKEVNHKPSHLSLEGLTSFAGPVHAFVAGLMLLAMLILLAACANLGSLFAAHAADRSKEVALRLALGSNRTRILRQLLTEALLISISGGALGLLASIALLRAIATWQPVAGAPLHIPVSPDARLYSVALLLAVLSGFLFGIVPVRQVLRANPWEVVKAGRAGLLGHRFTLRDILLVAQIAICAMLVTASLVAVRGLLRSMHSSLGFQPRNTLLLSANLAIGGFSGDAVLPMQKKLIDAMAAIPGVERVGVVDDYPPLVDTAANRANIFNDDTRDFVQANVAARPYRYAVSPGYFEAAATSLLAGRDFTWHDDKNAARVAIANREFARRMFGSVTAALGRFLRVHDGTRVQIIGVVEDGKYLALTEDQEPAIFVPSIQSPNNQSYVVVRSGRDPQELAAAMRHALHEVDPSLPGEIRSWNDLLSVVLFPSRVATMALGVLGLMGAILSITGIFGMAASSVSKRLKELGIRVALGARRTEVLQTALGRAFRLLAIGSAAGLILGFLAGRVLSNIVYQATPRDPFVLAGVVLSMALLGLLASWVPAQRALAVDPMALLRED